MTRVGPAGTRASSPPPPPTVDDMATVLRMIALAQAVPATAVSALKAARATAAMGPIVARPISQSPPPLVASVRPSVEPVMSKPQQGGASIVTAAPSSVLPSGGPLLPSTTWGSSGYVEARHISSGHAEAKHLSSGYVGDDQPVRPADSGPKNGSDGGVRPAARQCVACQWPLSNEAKFCVHCGRRQG